MFVVGGNYDHSQIIRSVQVIMESKSPTALIWNFKKVIGEPYEFPWYDMDVVKESYPQIQKFQKESPERQNELIHKALKNAPKLLFDIYGEKKPFIKKLR